MTTQKVDKQELMTSEMVLSEVDIERALSLVVKDNSFQGGTKSLSRKDMDTVDLEQNINSVVKLGYLSSKQIGNIRDSQGKQKRKMGGDKKSTQVQLRIIRGATAKSNQ